MKIKTALIAALFLGLITYTIPLYAGSKEYHIEEETVIEIPMVGKLTTLTSSYFSGCKLMEKTRFKMHNSLLKMMVDDGGSEHSLELSDLCEQLHWEYDSELERYEAYTFEEIRGQKQSDHDDHEVQIDMGVDQNDMKGKPRITRSDASHEKNINGFRCQKVVTKVHLEDTENPLLIEEYYTTKAHALSKINAARQDVRARIGALEDTEGVPEFIQLIYRELKENHELSKPEGEVVRLHISLLDKDNDEIFLLDYNVTVDESTTFNADHFSLK